MKKHMFFWDTELNVHHSGHDIAYRIFFLPSSHCKAAFTPNTMLRFPFSMSLDALSN